MHGHALRRAAPYLGSLGLVLLFITLAHTEARAQSDEGPLAGAPPIMGQRLMREGRFELSPKFGITFGDAYERHLMPGLGLTYHLLDWLGVGADIEYALTVDTGLHEQIDRELRQKVSAICPDRDSACLSQLQIRESIGTASLMLLATANASLVPIKGKFMLFGEWLVRYDLHVLLGAGIALLREEGGLSADETISVTPVWGIGSRMFVNDFVALNLELRDYIVKYPLATDQSGNVFPAEFHNHFTLFLGVSFFLPTEPRIEPVE